MADQHSKKKVCNFPNFGFSFGFGKIEHSFSDVHSDGINFISGSKMTIKISGILGFAIPIKNQFEGPATVQGILCL